MKTLLLMLIVSVCALAWRSPEIMQTLGVAAKSQDPARMTTDVPLAATPLQQKPMTAAEFAKLSKTDPQAYQKFLNSLQVQDQERNAADKLMNFLAHGKFE